MVNQRRAGGSPQLELPEQRSILTAQCLKRAVRRVVDVDSAVQNRRRPGARSFGRVVLPEQRAIVCTDRKSTRLNSSHRTSSYAVFCLKKKKKQIIEIKK